MSDFFDPMDCSLPGSSVHGISQARILKWVTVSFSRGSSQPRDRTRVSCIRKRILYHWATREDPREDIQITNKHTKIYSTSLVIQFNSVQSLSPVRLFATSWIAARQASLSITNSWSSPRLTSIESVMPSSHLVLCRPLLLLPPIPPSIRVFSNESTLRMR